MFVIEGKVIKFVEPVGWIEASVTGLDLDGALDGLALLLLAGDGLGTHDTTTPVTAGLLVLVGVALLDGGNKLGEVALVLLAYLGDCEDGRGLAVS